VIKSCIRIILPASCRYTFKDNKIAQYYINVNSEERNLNNALGFDCPECYKRFPKSMTARIKKFIKNEIILNKLKENAS